MPSNPVVKRKTEAAPAAGTRRANGPQVGTCAHVCLHGTPTPQLSRSFPVHNEPSRSFPPPSQPPPAWGLGTEQPSSIHQGTSASPSSLGHKSNHEEETKRKKRERERGSEERKNQGRGWGERAMEGGWGTGVRSKAKFIREITKLFIFPRSQALGAFEASTLMYLDILGPSAIQSGHPSPTKARRFHQPRGCPRSLLKWVLVVFTRLRV